mmetsp:Transcript_110836/g.253958  ORF Transcript_110836/g.253958 Transcript_110836/m.253958 type:complete len:256 (+) Transcript_110836:12-779(+)
MLLQCLPPTECLLHSWWSHHVQSHFFWPATVLSKIQATAQLPGVSGGTECVSDGFLRRLILFWSYPVDSIFGVCSHILHLFARQPDFCVGPLFGMCSDLLTYVEGPGPQVDELLEGDATLSDTNSCLAVAVQALRLRLAGVVTDTLWDALRVCVAAAPVSKLASEGVLDILDSLWLGDVAWCELGPHTVPFHVFPWRDIISDRVRGDGVLHCPAHVVSVLNAAPGGFFVDVGAGFGDCSVMYAKSLAGRVLAFVR